jgi:hypothetical protein
MSNTASTLTNLAETQFGAYSVRSHTDRINSAASAIDADPSPENIAAVVRSQTAGLGVHVPQSFIDTVVSTVGAQVAVDEVEPMAHLTDEQVTALVEVANKAGYRGGVDGLVAEFVAAGLLPEPVVEPEPEVEDDKSLLQRLVEFAKGYGFKG